MDNFLSLLMFIIAFGVLITIHELGHLITAKMFNVYCSDFSIGFGYKILKIVRDDPDEKNVVWVYKSSLKDLKKDTDFTIIGRRLVFYRTIQGNLQVQYDG